MAPARLQLFSNRTADVVWAAICERGDVPGLHRVLTGVDRDSIEMREVSHFGGLLSPEERREAPRTADATRPARLRDPSCLRLGSAVVVTAVELARRLRIAPKRLRDWLRAEARAGHPLLAGHVHYGRWEFNEEEAAQLEAEYRGSAGRPQPTSTTRSKRRKQAAKPAEHDLPMSAHPGHRVVETWRGGEVETLADLLRPGLKAVCIGINPSPVSVAAGHYYQGQVGKRFWQRLRDVGLLDDRDFDFEDDAAFAAGVGFTDIVKRPSARADDLEDDEFEAGRYQLVAKLERYRPGLIIFTFKKTAVKLIGQFAGYGFVPHLEVAGIPAFVMPGPYERADRAEVALSELREYLRRA
jgi:double-stranded uracil-DNA glycosylase